MKPIKPTGPPCHDGALYLYLFLLAIFSMAFYLTVALLHLTVDPMVGNGLSAAMAALAMAARGGGGNGSGGSTAPVTPATVAPAPAP